MALDDTPFSPQLTEDSQSALSKRSALFRVPPRDVDSGETIGGLADEFRGARLIGDMHGLLTHHQRLLGATSSLGDHTSQVRRGDQRLGLPTLTSRVHEPTGKCGQLRRLNPAF